MEKEQDVKKEQQEDLQEETMGEDLSVEDDRELTRENFLNEKDIIIHRVDLPEKKGHTYVRSMTALDRDRFEVILVKLSREGEEMNESLRARLVFMTACDSEGNRLFTKEKDVAILSKKNWKVMDAIASKAQEVNKLREKDVKEMAKNS
jgi:hypothetical protein